MAIRNRGFASIRDANPRARPRFRRDMIHFAAAGTSPPAAGRPGPGAIQVRARACFRRACKASPQGHKIGK